MENNTNYIENILRSCVTFLAPMSPFDMCKTIVTEAIALVSADSGSIYIKKNRNLEKIYSSTEELFDVRPRKNGNVREAFETGKVLVFRKGEPTKVHDFFREASFQSHILIPLSYGGDSLGVLCLQSKKEKYFTPEDIRILKLFCSMAFLSIRKTQLYLDTMEALQTRDLFIGMASHELKTPLTSLHLYVGLLERKLGKSSNRKLLEPIQNEVARLTSFVQELLEVDLIKKRKLQYVKKDFFVEDVLKQALTSFKITHPLHTVYFRNRLSRNPKVYGDYNKILQVVINLLNNAAKYSDSISAIQLIMDESENGICIVVKDKGKGIPKRDLPKIFNKYYKAKNSHHEGMGLGLYIIKNIVDQHKGNISIASELNRGTEVTVKLPEVTI